MTKPHYFRGDEIHVKKKVNMETVKVQLSTIVCIRLVIQAQKTNKQHKNTNRQHKKRLHKKITQTRNIIK